MNLTHLMGTYKGGEKEDSGRMVHNDTMCDRLLNTISSTTFMACLFSFLVSMAGGALLLYWELKYHPTNRQLWMVPFGLIFFCTPIFIIFAVTLSDFLNPNNIAPPPRPGANLRPAAASCQPDDKAPDIEANSIVGDCIISRS